MVNNSKYFLFFLLFSVLVSCTSSKNQIVINTPSVEEILTLGGGFNESATSVVAFYDGGYAVVGFSQSIDGDVQTSKTEVQYDFWVLRFNSEGVLIHQNVYGGTADDKAYKAIATNDNGLVVVGYSESADGDVFNNQGLKDVWVLKLDNEGVIQWQTNTGFTGVDSGYSLIQTSDGGYFIGGILDVTASQGEGNQRLSARHAGGDYWGLKLDATGNIEWRRYFGGSNTDTCYDVVEANDGYILVGSSDSTDVDISNNLGSYDFWVVKVDKSGSLLWEKSFGGDEIDEARGIVNTNDGNFIIVGDTRSSNQDITHNNGAADCWIVKINTNGEILWEKSFGGSSFDAARSITKTQDGGYLIAGSSRSLDNGFINQGQNDAWLLKIDKEGDEEWQKTIGGSNVDILYDAIALENENIIAVGESLSNDGDVLINKGFSDLLIIKLK